MVGGLPSPVLPGVSTPLEAKPLGLGLERDLELGSSPKPLIIDAPPSDVLVALDNSITEIVGPEEVVVVGSPVIVAAHSLDPSTGAGAARESIELPVGLMVPIGGGAENDPGIHLVTERGARVTRGRAVMGWVCRPRSSVIPLNSGLSP